MNNFPAARRCVRGSHRDRVARVNGTIRGGHVNTASFTVASKKNINDDFSPTLTEYPNAPSNIEAEWGRSRADERYDFVASPRAPYVPNSAYRQYTAMLPPMEFQLGARFTF